MYYSSESSDNEISTSEKSSSANCSSLDLSYLMLDSAALGLHLQNCVREQRDARHLSSPIPPNRDIKATSEAFSRVNCDSSENTMEIGISDDASTNVTTSSSRVSFPSDIGLNESQVNENVYDTVTQKLFLQHNLLLSVPFEIVKFSNLRTLDISNNDLTHVNDFLLHLPELQSFYARNNSLMDDGLPKDMSSLTKLKELNLSGNQFTRVPNQLYELSGLRYLYLGNNQIMEVLPDIKSMQSLQVLHLGGNLLETVPDELGDLQQLGALILCDNRLRKLPRAISNLTKLRSLLLHKNNLCCLPVGVVKLKVLTELSLRDNPLVTRFVNSRARELMFNPPTLLELAARVIKLKKIHYTVEDLPHTLMMYLNNGQRCVNTQCKGMYFTSCVEHIKFVDFCGMYRVPLMHYLCSSRCSSKTPSYYKASSSESESEEDQPAARMKRVLLG